MLINCTNKEDPKDIFVINPPVVLPINSKIVYHNRTYIITEILYDDESGVVDYSVVQSKQLLDNNTLIEEVLEYCRKKQKLYAVKFVKERLGIGLRESKDYVDDLCKKYKIQ